MRTFASDNYSGVHPKILQAIVECNEDHEFPYGEDYYSKKAIEKFKELFGCEVEVHFAASGTGSNVIALSSLLRGFEGVICAESAHINVDECGSLERFSGTKIIEVPHYEGKIRIEDIKNTLAVRGIERHNQPRVISISQTTEFGTVYTVEEIKEIVDYAHENQLLVHIDGARIPNAAAKLGVSFKEMITDTGVDLLSFGGTKNGMMNGEAVISFNPEASCGLKYVRKQGMQVISKGRYIGAQFVAYLENELWKTNAEHANKMAKLLESELKCVSEISFAAEVQSNMIFAELPKAWIKPLQDKYYFYVADENTNLVRWVTSFDTTEEEIMDFVSEIKKLKDEF